MGDVTVTLDLDAAQYRRELAGITSVTDGLSRSGGRIGDGFLRGERAVSRAAAFMVRDLAQAQSAADAVGTALLGIERAGFIGLVPAVAIAAGVTAFEFFRKEVEKTKKASDDLGKALSVPLALEVNLSPEDISKRIDEVTKSTDELIKRKATFSSIVGGILAGIGAGAAQGRVPARAEPQVDPDFARIRAGLKEAKDLAIARADAELRIVGIKESEVTLGKSAAASAKIELDYARAQSQLLIGAFKPGADQAIIFRRFTALTKEKDAAQNLLDIQKERVRVEQNLDSITTKAAISQIGKGGVESQRIELQTQVELTDAKLQAALQELSVNKQNADAQNAVTKALEGSVVASANLEKFEEQTTFTNAQQLKAAQAVTKEMQLEAVGQSQAANLVKIREHYEALIAQHLREGRKDLADQDRIQENIALREAQGLPPTPTGGGGPQPLTPRGNYPTAGTADIPGVSTQGSITKAREDAFNAFFHKAKTITEDATTQIPPEDIPEPPALGDFIDLSGQDFSGVASLAGLDYSGVASIAALDFSGIQTLSGITINIV